MVAAAVVCRFGVVAVRCCSAPISRCLALLLGFVEAFESSLEAEAKDLILDVVKLLMCLFTVVITVMRWLSCGYECYFCG